MNTIPICFSTDNNYFPYMAAAIHSVMENSNKQQLYQIFVLYADTDISEENKVKLVNLIKVYDNFTVEYIDVTNYIKEYSFNTTFFPKESYCRLLIPYILDRYEKVIYLDCDIICLEDIAKILNDKPTDAVIDGVRNIFNLDKSINDCKEYIAQLGIKKSQDYFNAGVLVFNTAAFTKTISQDKLFSMANLSHIKYADQCILNIVCEGRVRFLDMAWNVMPVYNIKLQYPFNEENKIAKEHPYIIHYIDKPWKQFYVTKRQAYFWQYAIKTPFFDAKYPEINDGDLRESIYNDIRNGKRFGPKFITRCSALWIITKLNFFSKMFRGPC